MARVRAQSLWHQLDGRLEAPALLCLCSGRRPASYSAPLAAPAPAPAQHPPAQQTLQAAHQQRLQHRQPALQQALLGLAVVARRRRAQRPRQRLGGGQHAALQGGEAQRDVLAHRVLHQLAAAVARAQLRQQRVQARLRASGGAGQGGRARRERALGPPQQAMAVSSWRSRQPGCPWRPYSPARTTSTHQVVLDDVQPLQ